MTPVRDRHSRDKIDALAQRVARLHRHVLEPDVLEGVFPFRLAWARHRATLEPARARAAAFRAAAPAYARHADGLRAEPVRRVNLAGLQWSVPLTRPHDAEYSERYVAKQDFPFRAIAQTREVSLGGVMLDIGGNIGRMSIPRVILGDVQAAYCAEPEPLNYSCLASNVTDNGLAGLVMPDRAAIGAVDGTVRLRRGKSAGGHFLDDRGGDDTIEVPCWRLDTWIDRLGVDRREVTFVKVDTQGFEGYVLEGAAALLAHRHVAWQIEIDPPLLGHRGYSATRVFETLQRSFTHFVDLNRDAPGVRVRTVGELSAALAYVSAPGGGRTDILAFNASAAPG